MLRHNLCRFAISFLMIFAAIALRAQESKPQPPTSTYKLEYVFSEVQDGKRINATSSKEGNQIQYLDIGVNIDCRVEQELESGITLFTNVETSSLAHEPPGENRTDNPVIRQVRYQVDSVVPLGKSTLLGSADEVDGTRRLQIEVTATKVR